MEVRPITLWDSEYGCAKFVQLTADINADKLIRLRPNRCIWGQPKSAKKMGRPRKHGDKMKLSDPTTWAVPVESMEINDPTWGIVKIRAMESISFLSFPRPTHGNYPDSKTGKRTFTKSC